MSMNYLTSWRVCVGCPCHFFISTFPCLTMRPKLPPPPHATPMKKRQSVNLLQAAESFFYVAGMMATLSVAGYQESGTRGSGRRCEKGNTVRRPMPGARPDSALGGFNAVGQSAVSEDDLFGQSMAPARGRAGPGLPRSTPRPVFRRIITSTTVMRAMHVTQAMAECLGLYGDSGTAAASDDRPRLAEEGAAMATMARSRPHASKAHARHERPAFRSPLIIQDSAGNEWPVMYEASTSNRQYHRRLSEGWAAFCRHHGVQINDTIEFRRCFKSEIDGPRVLAVRVLRKRSDDGEDS